MRIPTLSIPAAEYHAASRRGEYMSSHLLADFRESPALYRKKIDGDVPDSESPALALGRAAHCHIVSDGPINPKTGESFGRATKTYSEWLASQGREIVSCRDYGFIMKLQNSVWLHDAASVLLDQGQAEGVLRTEYCGVPCQVRLDWLSPEHGLVDFKTCDSLKWFETDCRRFGYVFQLAFYQAVIREAPARRFRPPHCGGKKRTVFDRRLASLRRGPEPSGASQRGGSVPLPPMPGSRRVADRL